MAFEHSENDKIPGRRDDGVMVCMSHGDVTGCHVRVVMHWHDSLQLLPIFVA